MKKKITVLIIIAAFVGLIVGAKLLYDNLSENTTSDQLEILTPQPPKQSTEQASESHEEIPTEPSGGASEPSDKQSAETESDDFTGQSTAADIDNSTEQSGKETTEAPETQSQEQSTEQNTVEDTFRGYDFVVYDLQGNQVRLSDFVGKPVVLNFWASWCGPCRSEMPDFQTKYEELGDEIHFLMVNLTDNTDETVASASSFIASQGYTFPVYFDTSGDAAYTYSVYSIPTTYFIDAEGRAIARATGAIDSETLSRGIDMIK